MIFPNDDQLKDNIQKNLIFYRKKQRLRKRIFLTNSELLPRLFLAGNAAQLLQTLTRFLLYVIFFMSVCMICAEYLLITPHLPTTKTTY